MTTPNRPPTQPSTIDTPVIPTSPTTDPAPTGTVVTAPTEPPTPRRLTEVAKEAALESRRQAELRQEQDRVQRERQAKQRLQERGMEAARDSRLAAWFPGQRWEAVEALSDSQLVLTDLPYREVRIRVRKEGPNTYALWLVTSPPGATDTPLVRPEDLGNALLRLER